MQLLEELEDLGLDRDVERGRRLIGDHEGGVHHEGHRDHDALTHAAGQLMRVFPRPRSGRGNSYYLEHLHGASPRLAARRLRVNPHDLGDLLTDGKDGIERRHRLLKHHGDARATNGAQLSLS